MIRKFRKAALAAEKQGFFRDLGRHFATFNERGSTCVVTFDNMKSRDAPPPRYPWGYGLCSSRDYSHLGIMMNRRNDWFRQKPLAAFFDELRDADFFDQFESVIFYGSSMGGYAALTYAASYTKARAVAFMPQTSIHPKHVPWESRYANGLARGDWGFDDYADAAETVPKFARAQIFYDPYFELDNAHAQRLKYDNVDHFRCPFMGHKIARYFKHIGILQETVTQAIGGTLDMTTFQQLFRKRRDNTVYARMLVARAMKNGRPDLGEKAVEWMRANHPQRNTLRLEEKLLKMRESFEPEASFVC